jgi:hypothetical protein
MRVTKWTNQTGSGVLITVDADDRLQRLLLERSGDAQRIAVDALGMIGDEFVTEARRRVRGGRFQASLDWARDGDDVVVGSTSPLAHILEVGRRPGRRPSPQSLAAASGMSLGAAVKAADAIAESGTKGMHTVRNSAAQVRRDGGFDRMAAHVMTQVGSLDGGR